MWVLRLKTTSSAKTAGALNLGAMSPAPCTPFYQFLYNLFIFLFITSLSVYIVS
ncbi:hypothetical protein I79_003631 [Cricetulus griseus]|uniref:Uncharacterized protein n=1 Tax=Cricetulus griseus TaxID=10029 RepID=G3H0H4_CRIGR|nr:hypothetical protein I79_003631 [Cricetulus griseus]